MNIGPPRVFVLLKNDASSTLKLRTKCVTVGATRVSLGFAGIFARMHPSRRHLRIKTRSHVCWMETTVWFSFWKTMFA